MLYWLISITKNRLPITVSGQLLDLLSPSVKSRTDIYISESSINNSHFYAFEVPDSPNSTPLKVELSDESIYAISGIILNKRHRQTSMKIESMVTHAFENATSFYDTFHGKYSIIRINNEGIQVLCDPFCSSKCFVYRDDSGNTFITNYFPFLEALFSPGKDHLFYASWIITGELPGGRTHLKNVSTIPPLTKLSVSQHGDVSYSKISSIPDFLHSELDIQAQLDQVAAGFQIAAANLSELYTCILPISGGYDSRLVLEQFLGTDRSKITTYTYPDHPYDTPIANQITRQLGIKHFDLSIKQEPPRFSDVMDYIFREVHPLPTYGAIFEMSIEPQGTLFDESPGKVFLSGNGGDTELAVLNEVPKSNHDVRTHITTFAQSKYNSPYLSPSCKELLIHEMIENHSENYGTGVKLGNPIDKYHFHFERFLQSQLYPRTKNLKLNESFQPFSDSDFLRLLFAMDNRSLVKYERNSVHHLLSQRLNSPLTIRFTEGRSWNESGWERWKRKLIHTDPKPLELPTKIAHVLRDGFYRTNQHEFKAILDSSSHDEIWELIDRDAIQRVLSRTDLPKSKDRSIMFRLIPYLSMCS